MEKRLMEIIKNARRVNTEGSARSLASRIKSGTIVLGDDGYYWIVTAGEASILRKDHYEILR